MPRLKTLKPRAMTLRIPSGKIAALCWGDKNASPMLAVHGWLDNAASFNTLAPLLAQNHYVVALDLPGHGLSTHRPHGIYFHFVDYIADLITILDLLGWNTCKLLGHSLGACLFSIVAGVIPERITHLALLDALGPFTAKQEDLPQIMRSSILQHHTGHKKRFSDYDNIETAVAAKLKASPMKQSSMLAIVERGIKKTGDKYSWRTDPRLLLKPMIILTEEQLGIFLKNITAPVYLLLSRNACPFAPALIQQRIKLIPNITVQYIDGGHHFHLDEPTLVADLLNKFFK